MSEAPPGDPAASAEFRRAVEQVQSIREQVAKAVIGQREVIEQVLIALLAGGHVLLEGVPGLGKTLIVLALSRTFAGSFTRIQFTPDLMPSDVTGHAMYDRESRSFHIRKGPAFTNLLLADEINRAPAKTQAALLEVMQEQQVSIEGESFELERPFMTLATQNPIEQEGTYPLPEAQVDRFLLKVRIDYPPEQEEHAMLRQVTEGRVGDRLDVSHVESVVTPGDIRGLQAVAARVLVDQRVADYALRLVRATRSWQGLRVGAGPRGAIALVRAARARALLEARDYATPDDVSVLARPCLTHRVILAPELEIEGHRSQDVIAAVLEKVEAPRT